jgi:hypothetical protein
MGAVRHRDELAFEIRLAHLVGPGDAEQGRHGYEAARDAIAARLPALLARCEATGP